MPRVSMVTREIQNLQVISRNIYCTKSSYSQTAREKNTVINPLRCAKVTGTILLKFRQKMWTCVSADDSILQTLKIMCLKNILIGYVNFLELNKDVFYLASD